MCAVGDRRSSCFGRGEVPPTVEPLLWFYKTAVFAWQGFDPMPRRRSLCGTRAHCSIDQQELCQPKLFRLTRATPIVARCHPLQLRVAFLSVCWCQRSSAFSCPLLLVTLIRELTGCGLTTLPAGIFSPLVNLVKL